MEPHRHRPGTGLSDAARKPGEGGSRKHSAPTDSVEPARRPALEIALDAGWLEREALRCVARSETSRRMIAERLERKISQHHGETGEESAALRASIPEVIARLVERGYLDDRRFGEQQLSRLRRQGRSLEQIRSRLEAKGLSEVLIRELTSQADPELEHELERQAAFALARRRRIGPYYVSRAGSSDASDRLALRDRHLAIMARQGFSLETSTCVIDAEMPPGTE